MQEGSSPGTLFASDKSIVHPSLQKSKAKENYLGSSQSAHSLDITMGDSEVTERVDCVVVGAGWYGLGAAKQFHVTQPKASLVVFETESSVGGTWGDGRLYPGLKTNNLWGTYEFPDFPMTTERFGVKEREHIPGTVVNAYMKAYATEFGIDKLLRFNSKVTVAEHHDEGGWTLTVQQTKDEEKTYKIFTRRLIVATGLTSDPFLPHYKGQETFGGPIFHTKQFKDNADTVKKAKSVTVIGAGKSGYDAVYAYATAGVSVNWVIRSTGHGPTWIAPPFVTPLKKWIEKLAHIRALTWFSPCIFADADGYSTIRSFYHNTIPGRFLTNQFWNVLGNDVLTLCNYDAHPETAKLKPWIPAMWTATSFSILNYEQDFYDLIRSPDSKIRIHVGELDHLSPGTVHLTDGTSFPSDAILSSSGWKIVPPMKFLPEGIEAEIGLPHPIISPESSTPIPESDLGNNHALLAKADKEILTRFPRLKDQPTWNKNFVPVCDTKAVSSSDPARPDAPLTPYTLYRFTIPASEKFLRTRDIAFSGMVSNFSNVITSHIQGLWISAYFQNKLVINPSTAVDNLAKMEDLRYETVLHNRFGKWRYPVDWGNRHPSFIFDAVPYLDLLCRDLGISSHRKGGKGVLAEIYDPYGPEDYADVVEEWKGKFGEGK